MRYQTKSKPDGRTIVKDRLARFCKKCGDRFIPQSKYSWICDKCNKKMRRINSIYRRMRTHRTKSHNSQVKD